MHADVCKERRTFDPVQMDLHDCILASAALRQLRTEYDLCGVNVPTWIRDREHVFSRRIRDLKADQQAHRVSQLRSQLAALQNPDERRAAIQKELGELEASFTA